MRTAHPATKKLVRVAWYSAVTPRLGKLFLIYGMASNEHSYDEGKDEPYYDELMDEETLRPPRTNEALFKEAGRSCVDFPLVAVVRSSLREKRRK